MPSDWSLYPDDWPEIAHAVKEAADWTCEECGHVHDPASGYTLTAHHRDGDPRNNAPENLQALCQRCHLRIHGHRNFGHWASLAFPATRTRFGQFVEQLSFDV
jgi:5-methylcytosine-specific restriction endonuclease McrA